MTPALGACAQHLLDTQIITETLPMLCELRREGTIRAIGITVGLLLLLD